VEVDGGCHQSQRRLRQRRRFVVVVVVITSNIIISGGGGIAHISTHAHEKPTTGGQRLKTNRKPVLRGFKISNLVETGKLENVQFERDSKPNLRRIPTTLSFLKGRKIY
jgi:hypothetical protein